MIAILPLVIAIIGLLIYAFAQKNPPVAEIGRLLFFIGAFWAVYLLAHETVSLLPRR